MQTLIENKYIEDMRSDTKATQRRQMDKWRTAICTVSKNT